MSTDGGPAFPKPRDPYPNCDDATGPSWNVGMSQRDWFAGQALQPCITMVITIETNGGYLDKDASTVASEMAYEIADAMLRAREAK